MYDAHRATHPGVKKYTLIGRKGIVPMFDFKERGRAVVPDEQIGDTLPHRRQRVDHGPCGSQCVHNLVMIRIDQEIYIEPVDNPFSVYFDPNSVAPDGSDAERCLITTVIPKSKFRDLYPGKDDGTGFTSRGTGDSSASWVMRDDIRIAEYFHVEREAATLCLMEDGTSVFESDLPDEAIPFVIDRRKSARRVVKWC